VCAGRLLSFLRREALAPGARRTCTLWRVDVALRELIGGGA
jgi:hypothetical protein